MSKDKLDDVLKEQLRQALEQVEKGDLKGVIKSLRDNVVNPHIKTLEGNVEKGIGDKLNELKEKKILGNLVKSVLNPIVDKVPIVGEAGRELVNLAADILDNVVSGLVDVLKKVIKTIFEVALGDKSLADVKKDLKDGIRELFDIRAKEQSKENEKGQGEKKEVEKNEPKKDEKKEEKENRKDLKQEVKESVNKEKPADKDKPVDKEKSEKLSHKDKEQQRRNSVVVNKGKER